MVVALSVGRQREGDLWRRRCPRWGMPNDECGNVTSTLR